MGVRAVVCLLAVVAGLSGCCATAPPNVLPTKPIEPDMSRIVILVGQDGFAHACPISPNLVLTARHVAVGRRDTVVEAPRNSSYAFSQGDIRGYAGYLLESEALDLAVMKLTEDVPYYETTEPKLGETVWLLDYDRDNDTPFWPKIVTAKIKTILPHHFFLSDFGQPGSSGSCVVNSEGKVVGIYVAYFPLQDLKDEFKTLKTFGVAVSLDSTETATLLANLGQ